MKKVIYSLLFLVSVVSISSPAYAQLGHQSFGTLGSTNTDNSFTIATKSLISDPFYFFKRLGESIRIAFGSSNEEKNKPQAETKSEEINAPAEEKKETTTVEEIKEQTPSSTQEPGTSSIGTTGTTTETGSDTETSVTGIVGESETGNQIEQTGQTSTGNTETGTSDSGSKSVPAIEVSKVIPIKILPGKFGD